MRIYFVGEFDDKVKEEYKQFWFIKDEQEYEGCWFYRIKIVEENYIEYKDWTLSMTDGIIVEFLHEMEKQQWDVLIYWDCFERLAWVYRRKLFKRINSNSAWTTNSYLEKKVEYFLWEEYKNTKDYFLRERDIPEGWSYYVVRADSIVNYSSFEQSCENFKVVDRISCNVKVSNERYNYIHNEKSQYYRTFDEICKMKIGDKEKIKMLKVVNEMLVSDTPKGYLVCRMVQGGYWGFMLDHINIIEKLKEMWLTEEKAKMLMYGEDTPVVIHPKIIKKIYNVGLYNIKVWAA